MNINLIHIYILLNNIFESSKVILVILTQFKLHIRGVLGFWGLMEKVVTFKREKRT